MEWSNELSLPIFKGCDRLFNKISVDCLNEIIYLTGADIIVTSNWRLKLDLEELKKTFKNRGVDGYIKGITESFISSYEPLPIGNRGIEILKYIQTNNINNYVIIDDQVSDIIGLLKLDKIVKVNPLECLTSNDVDKILNILL